MTRLALSLVLGLGVFSGLSQSASAALPVATAANCNPSYGSNNYSAWNSPYSRTTANWYDNDRYGYSYNSKFNCGTTSTWDRYPSSRYSSWDNDYRYSDYSRLNRIRDAYNDRRDDYRHDRLPAHRWYDSNYRY